LFCTSGSDTVAFGRIVIVDSGRPGWSCDADQHVSIVRVRYVEQMIH
jgi:hypothetical protein